MLIPENVQQNTIRYLGDKAKIFFINVENRLKKYTVLWELSQITYMPTNTVNLLFSCESALYGSCVLKMCIPGPEVANEVHCLQAYDGKG